MPDIMLLKPVSEPEYTMRSRLGSAGWLMILASVRVRPPRAILKPDFSRAPVRVPTAASLASAPVTTTALGWGAPARITWARMGTTEAEPEKSALGAALA